MKRRVKPPRPLKNRASRSIDRKWNATTRRPCRARCCDVNSFVGRLRKREREHEAGAALVEFALVIPILLAFLLAIVTGGLSIRQSVSLNNSARETARYGAVLPVDGDLNNWLATVADVAVTSATGDLSATSPGQRICVAYVYPDGSDTNDRTTRLLEVGGVRTITANATCMPDGRPSSERRVQITVERTGYFDAFIFATNITLGGQSVARFERFDR